MKLIADKLANAKKGRILVVGDVMLDRTISGTVSRISPEAPVQVVHMQDESVSLGGAANIAVNLRNCDFEVMLFGVIGSDTFGKSIVDLCKQAGIQNGLIETLRQTTVKERILGKTSQLLRVDYEQVNDIDKTTEDRILESIKREISNSTVIVIADFGKGAITSDFAKRIIYDAQKASVPVICDFKPMNLDYFIGCSLAILNEAEASLASNTKIFTEEDSALAAAKISKRLGSSVFITRAENGITVYSGSKADHVKGKKIVMSDISGAGDAVTAASAIGISAKLSIQETAELANHAGAIVCSKHGIATITLSELLSVLRTEISNYLWENILVKQKTIESQLDKIENVVKLIYDAYKNHKKILLFGNGGSAADAQHFAAELVGRYKIERVGLPAIALTTDSSVMTAIANDYSFDMVFARQVEALANEGDVVIGITTSGNSPNVNLAIEKAKAVGAYTIGLTGKDGGGLLKIADVCIIVPSDNTPRIQETHITIIHIVSELLEREMFAKERRL